MTHLPPYGSAWAPRTLPPSRSTSRPSCATSEGAAPACSSAAVMPHALPPGLRRRRVFFGFFSAMPSDEVAAGDTAKSRHRQRVKINPAARARAVVAPDRRLQAPERLVFVGVERAQRPRGLAQPVDLAAHAVGVVAREDRTGESAEIVEPPAERPGADEIGFGAELSVHRMAARGAQCAVDEKQRAGFRRAPLTGRFSFPTLHRRGGSHAPDRTSPPL